MPSLGNGAVDSIPDRGRPFLGGARADFLNVDFLVLAAQKKLSRPNNKQKYVPSVG